MSSAFITALNPSGRLYLFKATLSADKQRYVCACGLSVGVSVDNLDQGSSILSRPEMLRAAHQRHHDNHFGVPATLYLIGGRTPSGIETLAAAQCSCDYEEERRKERLRA